MMFVWDVIWTGIVIFYQKYAAFVDCMNTPWIKQSFDDTKLCNVLLIIFKASSFVWNLHRIRVELKLLRRVFLYTIDDLIEIYLQNKGIVWLCSVWWFCFFSSSFFLLEKQKKSHRLCSYWNIDAHTAHGRMVCVATFICSWTKLNIIFK